MCAALGQLSLSKRREHTQSALVSSERALAAWVGVRRWLVLGVKDCESKKRKAKKGRREERNDNTVLIPHADMAGGKDSSHASLKSGDLLRVCDWLSVRLKLTCGMNTGTHGKTVVNP